MLYALLYPLRDIFFGFNVLKYITFRATMAAITAFVLSVIIGPPLIRALVRLKTHHSHARTGFDAISKQSPGKAQTPTMGGLLITAAVVSSTLLWGELTNSFLWVCVLCILWLTGLGWADDYLKMKNRSSKGLMAMTKLTAQAFLAILVAAFLVRKGWDWTSVSIPFLKSAFVPLGIFYVAFVLVVVAGTSNAMNLTDGLDGLAIGCAILISITYALFSYLTGHAVFAEYLYLPYIPGAGELAVFCSAIVGAGLGFLWFNSHPATVFMGDTGSLSLGGALGVVAVLIKKELLLLIVGGVFAWEAMSVILQVASFKLTGKRIFKMAPIHHHFQLMGWGETKVVVRFWIIAIILCMVGLTSLKLR